MSDILNLRPAEDCCWDCVSFGEVASFNDWSAILWAGGEFYAWQMRENLEIYDRVGGGDGFAAGLAYGFLEGKGPQAAVE